MKIYLDINGTIIYRKIQGGKINVIPAPHLKEFLTNALKKHQVYWLSTMCQGDAQETMDYLRQFLTADILKLAAQVKPTAWGNYKVEAIDLSEDFLWFDDVLMQEEEKKLLRAGKLSSFVKVNHYKNSDFFQDWVNI